MSADIAALRNKLADLDLRKLPEEQRQDLIFTLLDQRRLVERDIRAARSKINAIQADIARLEGRHQDIQHSLGYLM